MIKLIQKPRENCRAQPSSTMIILSPKTLSPPPFLHLPHKNPNPKPPNFVCKSELRTERGLEFEIGESFFRHESAIGRDLGVLAASLYKKSKGELKILDAMCGCGVRSLRYLVEAEADSVLANDANDEYRRIILENLSRVPRGLGDEKRWVVTHFDANRVMTECYLQKDYFDLIDIDSFGSDSSFLRSALCALKLDGLVYVTSTDGFSSGGHRPYQVMLRFNRGKLPIKRYYGFIGYCKQCGHSEAFSWDKLGCITCPCNEANVSGSLRVIGPLWTGPLHNATYMTEMLNLAEEWGWTSNGMGLDLEKLLIRMIDESDPELPAGYIKLDEVSRRAKVNSPPLKTMMSIMQKEGYAVSRSHIVSNAIKTNCPMAMCVKIAKEINGSE
ncbi:uncharacterized protein LOC114257935 isoform X2 [Camellia sinensis]|uniref:uncharacterized protein LOC114257935 isoform X2 n=1 Tax=Camellia sinensis TaxID=4442 RepID=UPI0010363D9A|nr:uncharacterized protein LOC114257935 isoform X2 [Camellia sinensis]